jgi:hypothetical protein
MLRGELSNKPAPRFGVDYRILLTTNKGSKAKEIMSSALMAARLQGYVLGRYSWKRGAEEWIQKNFEYRAVGFVVGEVVYREMIAEVLGELVPEVEFFCDRHEFRGWARTAFEVVKVFTNDTDLLGLDEIVVPHRGWMEKVDGL